MTIVANSAARKRCPVCFRYLYICKLPVEARKEDLFYCCAVQKVPKDDPWHAPIPVDWNLLQNMVHNMCEEAGVSGRKNKSQPSCHECYYSVCCWSAWMSITVWTGHTSLDALRKYERVSLKQEATLKVQQKVTKKQFSRFLLNSRNFGSLLHLLFLLLILLVLLVHVHLQVDLLCTMTVWSTRSHLHLHFCHHIHLISQNTYRITHHITSNHVVLNLTAIAISFSVLYHWTWQWWTCLLSKESGKLC